MPVPVAAPPPGSPDAALSPTVPREAPAGSVREAPDVSLAASVVAAGPAMQAEPASHLEIAYRSQFDGSAFAWGNCGVAAISMAMAYYGHPWPTHEVRLSINELTGNWDLQVGVDWRFLRQALAQRGFRAEGPDDRRGGFQSWTLDAVLAETAAGRPVLLMAHYRSLPGHEEDPWVGDHYLLVLGEHDGQVVYHDPGFPGEEGAYRRIDRERLEHAWSNTWIGQDRTAMVILPPP